jgi:hypothetical protein
MSSENVISYVRTYSRFPWLHTSEYDVLVPAHVATSCNNSGSLLRRPHDVTFVHKAPSFLFRIILYVMGEVFLLLSAMSVVWNVLS